MALTVRRMKSVLQLCASSSGGALPTPSAVGRGNALGSAASGGAPGAVGCPGPSVSCSNDAARFCDAQPASLRLC
jgi:hypothetical protein